MDQVVFFVGTPTYAAARAIEHALESAARSHSPALARTVRFHVENAVPRLVAKLRSRRADALVIDARDSGDGLGPKAAIDLMQALFGEHDIGGPVGREQTWLVVDSDGPGTRVAFQAGLTRVAGIIPVNGDDGAWVEIWKRIESALRRRAGGRIALCLAGGGVEGLCYELGVLRALQYFLPEYRLENVDILCGISAGALIAGFMANGVSPDEIMRGMHRGEGRLDRMGRFSIFDPNVRELVRRLGKSAIGLLRGRQTLLQSLFRLAPSGAFAGEGLRRYLERQFNKPGMVDSFPELQHKLFIGATDQDSAEHVVFGSPGWDHIPIHLAIRASSALTPFYAPQIIEGRYYVDGAFTRTTNMRIAVEAGATLAILIDPLVPIASERPGYVASKGGVMVGMQGLKTLIHGRFDRAAHMLRAMYPHVAFHLFQPEGATMRVMSGSPMKFFYRPEIEDIAFRETVRSIRQHRFDSLHHDFARHDVLFVDPEADLGTIKRDMLDEASQVQVA